MPCDTIQTSSVSLELRANNKKHLMAALRALGYRVREDQGNITFSGNGVQGNFKNGKLNLFGEVTLVANFDVNPLKRAYSVEVVKSQAKRMGWTLTPEKGKQFAWQATKRGF